MKIVSENSATAHLKGTIDSMLNNKFVGLKAWALVKKSGDAAGIHYTIRQISFFLIFVHFPLFISSCSPLPNILFVMLFPPSVVEIGDDMVDAKLFDDSGNKQRLSAYLSDKYLLLSFCSSECGVCSEVYPELKEVSEIYRDNLTVISISLDSNSKWRKSNSERNISWVNLRDPKSFGGLAAKYGNDLGVPYHVIISPEGKVIDRWFGYGKGSIREKIEIL